MDQARAGPGLHCGSRVEGSRVVGHAGVNTRQMHAEWMPGPAEGYSAGMQQAGACPAAKASLPGPLLAAGHREAAGGGVDHLGRVHGERGGGNQGAWLPCRRLAQRAGDSQRGNAGRAKRLQPGGAGGKRCACGQAGGHPALAHSDSPFPSTRQYIGGAFTSYMPPVRCASQKGGSQRAEGLRLGPPQNIRSPLNRSRQRPRQHA